jgi:prophage regulatory protein
MRLIKLKEVIEKTSLGRSIIYEFMTKGTFPKQVSLGAKSVAWLGSDVDDWRKGYSVFVTFINLFWVKIIGQYKHWPRLDLTQLFF